MSKNDAKKIARKYADLLRKKRIAFKHVYLFGSHARGVAEQYSDIDIAVVVAKLPRGKGYLEASKSLWKMTDEVDVRIEPILVEERDLEEETVSIMGDQIRKYGILVV